MSKGDKQEKKLLTPLNVIMSILVAILLAIAIGEQLRRPPEERTWQGKVFGVPYDFRWPTLERLRATYWNADTTNVLVPQGFGMGWTINLYPLFHPQASGQQA